jgi:hypothetical protein
MKIMQMHNLVAQKLPWHKLSRKSFFLQKVVITEDCLFIANEPSCLYYREMLFTTLNDALPTPEKAQM